MSNQLTGTSSFHFKTVKCEHQHKLGLVSLFSVPLRLPQTAIIFM